MALKKILYSYAYRAMDIPLRYMYTRIIQPRVIDKPRALRSKVVKK